MSPALVARALSGFRSTLRTPRGGNGLQRVTVINRTTPSFMRLSTAGTPQDTTPQRRPSSTDRSQNKADTLALPGNGGRIRKYSSIIKDPDAWSVVSGLESNSPITLSNPARPKPLVLNLHALRDACACDKCVDPHSGQKNFGTTDIPEELSVLSSRRLEDASLEVVWENDFITSEHHRSVFPAEQVREWGFPQTAVSHKRTLPHARLWDSESFAATPSRVQYDDWMSDGSRYHEAVAQLHNYGLVFIDGVPKSEESVVGIATRIGHVMETFYGRTWDVRSKPQAENVAYTNTFLGLHQDLLYTADPPRVQFLHCLENSCEGGESIFSDSLRAAKLMELGPSHLFDALQKRKLVYHYNKDGHFYEKRRPVLDRFGYKVYWSPPFQSPHQSMGGHEFITTWVEAAKMFRQFLEDEKWLYEHKLEPGQCVIFDNLRVMHGRRRFDTSAGSRWLKGTYVSSDEWKSKRMTLAKEITEVNGENNPTPRKQARRLKAKHHI
ncbi:hypothetical protein PFICI_04172 [Pestalotiopsis fici W106-1]|uniref:TauD/TfdA-like domain-containing protein n=1 Tax=Pestalotiopsis fici (strain W106-1 / CGMCC3.15140) TaxID=1229662 RepID=W3XKZ8_PESFW|nr:uncharacterized protein PFICI_04172 [Pestalotiopsis fici W106-1]ETS86147.1 hypothetical protein PFICI_04172 [Pestalotiopsis fici W106-1]